jgi:hypothetical protein
VVTGLRALQDPPLRRTLETVPRDERRGLGFAGLASGDGRRGRDVGPRLVFLFASLSSAAPAAGGMFGVVRTGGALLAPAAQRGTSGNRHVKWRRSRSFPQ